MLPVSHLPNRPIPTHTQGQSRLRHRPHDSMRVRINLPMRSDPQVLGDSRRKIRSSAGWPLYQCPELLRHQWLHQHIHRFCSSRYGMPSSRFDEQISLELTFQKPIPILWRLRTGKPQKLLLTGIFTVGLTSVRPCKRTG